MVVFSRNKKPMIKDLKTIIEVIQFFNDEKICRAYLEQRRWNGTVTSLVSSSIQISKYKDERTYRCRDCKKLFKVTTGTIFENSKIPLRSWFAAMYLFTSHKTSVSALQISRHMAISQRSGWFMHHRIMEAVSNHLHLRQPQPGRWQVDEVYIGPLKNRLSYARKKKIRAGTGGIHSVPILGFYREGHDLFGMVLPVAADQSIIHPLLKKFICPMSTLLTDGSHLYQNLKGYFLSHEVFIHSDGEYARDGNHTNTIEGSFRHFKDSIRGTYKQLTVKHMQRYWDEFCFRYNTRNLSDIERFELLFETINRRITYKQLIDPNGRL